MKVIMQEHSAKPQVQIDPWDTRDMAGILSEIILPMLIQLKARKVGVPFVDDEDVPEHLKSTSAPPTKNEWDTDANYFKRWDWVLDEMIYAFDSEVNKDEVIMRFDPQTENEEMFREFDRIANGVILFAKYYGSLWS